MQISEAKKVYPYHKIESFAVKNGTLVTGAPNRDLFGGLCCLCREAVPSGDSDTHYVSELDISCQTCGWYASGNCIRSA